GDLVSVAGRGDSVGDEDGGAAFHDAVEAAEDPLFGVGVDAGQGVVEDKNFGVADDGAGDSCALFLTAGEGESTLADLGVEAFGEFENFITDVGDGGGFLHLFGGRVGSAEGDVLANGFGEEEGLLRDEADALAQCGQYEIADGAAVDENASRCCIVEA